MTRICLLEYTGEVFERFANLGDDIQTLAVSHLVPQVDGYVSREALDEVEQPCTVPLNGFFMNSAHWPPSPAVRPVFFAFHVTPQAQPVICSPAGIAYLKQWQPIGCRDRGTQALLAEHFGTQWEWVSREQLAEQVTTRRYSEALFERNALHFNPLDYAHGLARVAGDLGVALHEGSPAIALERAGQGWRVRTPQGEVLARHVVLTCGGYLAGLRREVDAGVLPIATYVMVTEPLGPRLGEVMRTRAAIYDTRFAFDYYRPLPDTRILWGGRISVRDRSPEQVKRLLRRDLLKVYPQLHDARIDYAWSGLMSYARHQMPQIGCVDEGLWLAQAFGGHGVAPTTFAGEVLAAAIAEDDPRWREFSRYGLVSAMKPAGFLGAQLSYWWYQARDAWKDRMEGRHT